MSRGQGGHQGGRRGPSRFQKPQHLSSTIRRLGRYLKGRLHLLFFGLVLMGISSLAGVAANAMLRPIINAFVYERSWRAALPQLLLLAVIYAGSALAQYIGARLMVGIAQRTTHALRSDLFDHLQQLPLAFYDEHSHGELMSSFTNDIDNINQALDQSLVQIITGVITFVGTLVMMLLLSPLLTAFVVVMVLLMFLIVGQVMKHSATNFRRQQASLASLNGYIEEMMEGQKVVKVFNREAETIEGFEGRNEELRQASTRAQVFAVVLFPIMGNLSYVQYAFTAMAGAVMTIRGIFDIGSVASFLQFTREFSRPINQVSNQFNVLISALAGAERVFRLMDVEPELDEGQVTLVDGCWQLPASATPPVSIPGLECEVLEDGSRRVRARGDMRFEHVHFSYVPGTEILHDISLYARPGQRIAFVGSTGAGKTTVTNLINRFYDIDSGRILIDGIDLREIRKADLRGVMGMVLQDIHLFEGTIADNIRYGRLDASDAEVREAARLANAAGFIGHLPEGYDTMLTRDGSNLSQGQRQLLSIARAALADPLILVLDEATSSVDTRTEAQIGQGMDQLMAGRTVFAIAHRLSTVRHSDAILVIEDGVIIERGDHEQLMEQGGRYYDLNVGTVELD